MGIDHCTTTSPNSSTAILIFEMTEMCCDTNAQIEPSPTVQTVCSVCWNVQTSKSAHAIPIFFFSNGRFSDFLEIWNAGKALFQISTGRITLRGTRTEPRTQNPEQRTSFENFENFDYFHFPFIFRVFFQIIWKNILYFFFLKFGVLHYGTAVQCKIDARTGQIFSEKRRNDTEGNLFEIGNSDWRLFR